MSNIIPSDSQKILDSQAIEQKINRMAYEILEQHHKVHEIVLLGIEDGGKFIVDLLTEKIQHIQDIQINTGSIRINKKKPYNSTPIIVGDTAEFSHKPCILVDDVGNTGSTLFHALQAVYPLQPATLHVAVLIDRTHKKFPIKADIVGLDLATTLKEHIHVQFDLAGKPEGAYIF